MLLLCIFSCMKSSAGDTPCPSTPSSRHGTVGKLASHPPHSGRKGVISFLSHPQRQGKEVSKARHKEFVLLRSHTNILDQRQLGRRQPRWPLLPHGSPGPLPNTCIIPKSPRSGRWGPFSFTLILSHPLSSQQAAPWSKFKEPTLNLGPPSWSGLTLRPAQSSHQKSTILLPFHTPCPTMPAPGAPSPRHGLTQKGGPTTAKVPCVASS